MKSGSLAIVVLLFLGVVFASIGAVTGLVFGKPMLDQAKATEQWPQTSGEVLESELVESRGDDGFLYRAHVVYRYALDGAEFESDRIWSGLDYSTSDRSEMQEIVRTHPVGKTVTVYYSPDDPAESVLMPGANLSSYVLFSVGLVFLAVGGFLLLIAVFLVARSVAGFPSDESAFRDTAFDDFNQTDRL